MYEPTLFDLPALREGGSSPLLHQLDYPIWTENKARLIARYLFLFVLVTRHGTYIDGFAGPQEADKPDLWAARLVLESRPRFLKNFYLFDKNRKQHQRLLDLRASHRLQGEIEAGRTIEVTHSDFNTGIRELLARNVIDSKEATFCLLDQRTFECQWATVAALARYPKGKYKIELFYFLPVGWLDRAFSAVRNKDILRRWWGRDDWHVLPPMSAEDRASLFCKRLKEEFGYASVVRFPIFSRQQTGGRIMYQMLHATDHPSAPELMVRAYHQSVRPVVSATQLLLFDGSAQASEVIPKSGVAQ